MSLVIKNGYQELKPKNYINFLVKLKDSDSYISIGCVISFLNNKSLHKEYELISRFYKIKSFQYDIPLDYVHLIMKKMYPEDIVYKIIEFYLKDDVSFSSIRLKNDSNTIKTIAKLKYSEKNQKYINDTKLSGNNNIVDLITSNVTKNFENRLNIKKSFDINNIFIINKDNAELCRVYKINNNRKAWGILINN